jgi:PD-(D/E)XK nuclease superfamily
MLLSTSKETKGGIEVLLDDIMKIEFYSGTKNSLETVSVSEVADNEPLIGYLKRKFEPKAERVSQATLGNIFDYGMKKIILDYKIGSYETGKRLNYNTKKGAKLTGEPDIIDEVNKIVYDIKLTKIYKHKVILTNPIEDAYGIQVNIYKLMLGWDDKSSLRLFMGLKDQTEVKPNQPDAIEEVEIPHITPEKLENMVDDYYFSVFSMLEGKEPIPDKCNETFGNDLRCKHYCSYNHVCKYGKRYNSISSTWF